MQFCYCIWSEQQKSENYGLKQGKGRQTLFKKQQLNVKKAQMNFCYSSQYPNLKPTTFPKMIKLPIVKSA